MTRTPEQQREYMREYMRSRRSNNKPQNGGKVLTKSQGGPKDRVTRARGSETHREALEDKPQVISDGGRLRRGDEFQMPGLACPDCYDRRAPHGHRWKHDPAQWCFSDQHPTFDATGQLIRMTRHS